MIPPVYIPNKKTNDDVKPTPSSPLSPSKKVLKHQRFVITKADLVDDSYVLLQHNLNLPRPYLHIFDAKELTQVKAVSIDILNANEIRFGFSKEDLMNSDIIIVVSAF